MGKYVGYSRAVKIGRHIEISGTVATDENKTIGAGDVYVPLNLFYPK